MDRKNKTRLTSDAGIDQALWALTDVLREIALNCPELSDGKPKKKRPAERHK